MKAYVGITDGDWFSFLSGRPDLDEVNFWQPKGKNQLRALAPGEPFLFKLHSSNNVIAGAAYFRHFTLAPVSLAWEVFGEKHGTASFAGERARAGKYRYGPHGPN